MKKLPIVTVLILICSTCLYAKNGFYSKTFTNASISQPRNDNGLSPFGGYVVSKIYFDYYRNKHLNGITFGIGFSHINSDDKTDLHPDSKTKWFFNQFYFSLLPQFSYYLGTNILFESTNKTPSEALSLNSTISYSLFCVSFRLQQDYFFGPNLKNTYSLSPQAGLNVSFFQIHIGPSFNIGTNKIKPVTMAFSTGVNVPLFRFKTKKMKKL